MASAPGAATRYVEFRGPVGSAAVEVALEPARGLAVEYEMTVKNICVHKSRHRELVAGSEFSLGISGPFRVEQKNGQLRFSGGRYLGNHAWDRYVCDKVPPEVPDPEAPLRTNDTYAVDVGSDVLFMRFTVR